MPRTLLLLLFAALPALAAAEPSPAQRQLVADLDSPDYTTRLTATESLLIDETLTPDALAELAPLAVSLEQKHRLLGIARHHALRQLRLERFEPDGPGSLGVVQTIQTSPTATTNPRNNPRNDPRNDPRDLPGIPPGVDPALDIARILAPGIVPGDGVDPDFDRGPFDRENPTPHTYALITRVLPGFPAAGRLGPGDRILAVDGNVLAGPAEVRHFEQLMRRYTAGQSLTLTIQREARHLDITVPLANGTALAAMYASPDFALTPDFRQPWQRQQSHRFTPLLTPTTTP